MAEAVMAGWEADWAAEGLAAAGSEVDWAAEGLAAEAAEVGWEAEGWVAAGSGWGPAAAGRAVAAPVEAAPASSTSSAAPRWPGESPLLHPRMCNCTPRMTAQAGGSEVESASSSPCSTSQESLRCTPRTRWCWFWSAKTR